MMNLIGILLVAAICISLFMADHHLRAAREEAESVDAASNR